ncbi:hypothetical protein SFC65_20410 [Priestia filamentosa]|uniref:hypothetical protein n=1 Tax=Priestia filamentosa TaxID=1402861 RepID=UPI003982BE01
MNKKQTEIEKISERGFMDIKWYDEDHNYTYYDAKFNGKRVEVRIHKDIIEWRSLGIKDIDRVIWFKSELTKEKRVEEKQVIAEAIQAAETEESIIVEEQTPNQEQVKTQEQQSPVNMLIENEAKEEKETLEIEAQEQIKSVDTSVNEPVKVEVKDKKRKKTVKTDETAAQVDLFDNLNKDKDLDLDIFISI